jgi:urease accessory protein
MELDAKRMRGSRPFVFTNLRSEQGVETVAKFIVTAGGLATKAA